MGIIKLKNANEEQTKNIAIDEQPVYGVDVEVNENTDIPQENQEQCQDPAVLYEDESRTDEHARHYVMNNGTAKSVFNAESVSYFDEEAKKWKPIDNSLKENADAYESKNGNMRTKIYKENKGKKVEIAKSDKQLSWEYLGKQAETVSVANENVETFSASVLKVNNDLAGESKNITSSAVYENIEKDTDLEYCLLGNNLKENIIVREKSADYRYIFALKTKGLKLRLSEDNESLELYTESTKDDGMVEQKVEFTIPAPFMYDANGESSDDVYYELEPSENGNYAFAVVASDEWINADERAFPVTIDPQIVTDSGSYLTKKVEYRNYYTSAGSGSGSGTNVGNWCTSSSNYIKVSRTSSQEYRTTLTIQKSNLNLLDLKISAVRLVLKPYRVITPGTCYIGGKYIAFSSTSDLSEKTVDITSAFRNANETCCLTLSYVSYLNVEFYFQGANAPVLEIEYLTNEKSRPVTQSFMLAGGLVGRYNVVAGDMTAAFTDIAETDSVLGIGISHIFKKSSDDLSVGRNFRLNLNETLIKNGDSVLDANYIYTDNRGDKHGFKDTYYYINTSGEKQSISNKTFIVVDMGGELTYTTEGKIYKVYQEQHTSAGLKAITKIEGFKYADYLEQREDEYKQLENQKQSCEITLKNMVLARTSDGDIVYRLQDFLTKDKFSTFISYVNNSSYLLCSETEAYNYKSLILQKKALQNQYESLGLQMTALQQSDKYNNNQNLKDQNTNYGKQQSLIGNSDYSADTQREVLAAQISFMKKNETLYKSQIEQYYKEYLNLNYRLEQYNRQIPVNYLTDGEIVKGFNSEGQLVTVLDKYENTMSIEYDANRKIQRVYDGNNKQIIFDYNPTTGLLRSITDTRGRRTSYEYNAQNELIKVMFSDGQTVDLVYDANGNIQSVESSDKVKSTLSYSNKFELKEVTNASTVSGVEHGQPSSDAIVQMSKIMCAFSPAQTTIADDKGNKKYYKINADGNVYEYYEEQNGLVIKAEKYDYVPYDKDNVQSAKRSSLFTKAYSAFSASDFTNGDYTNTKLDEYNNPATKTTNAQTLSAGTTQQTTITYEYDENHRCIKETATVVITGLSEGAKTYTHIMSYHYNASGNVVLKESYIKGEEYTEGKTIEETIYDEKGNVVKSFTYNSLDSSSKFYTESEVAENGQILADYDETGENKTEYGYIPGTDVVRTYRFANGSQFAYGHDGNDTVTSISQSTEEGEENSTQTRYTYGQVTELVSGNNVVRYAYDGKRRLKTMELNGVKNYVQYGYAETKDSDGSVVKETVTTAYASKDKYISEKDGNGNLLKLTANNVVQLENIYDKKGQLCTLKDKVVSKNYKFECDDFDNITVIYEADENGIQVSNGYGESVEYDDLGSIKKRTIVGPVSQVYDYTYKTDSTHALESITVNGSTIKPKLDVLGRNKGKEICIGSDKIAEESIAYRKVGDHATNMPTTIRFGNKFGDKFALVDSLRYAYNKMGNIEKVYENGELAIRYQYDALNRLIREDNKVMSTTVLYSYDNNGNILKQRKFAFTLKNIIDIEELESEDKVYIYDGDKLLSFNGAECAYNETTGMQTKYRGKSLGWTNRRVSSYKGIEFSYDGQGRRIAKGNISYIYDSQGRLLKQSNDLEFFYDHSGVSSVKHDGKTYFYRKDILGNIIALLDTSGAVVVKYTYDAWGYNGVSDINGNVISDENHIGNLNPFRYRGYYYDTETELYFLKTRYYDPEVGRFISPDSIEYLDPETINGLNLYAYCNNNPVSNVDPNGNKWWHWLIGAIIIIGLGVATALTGGAAGVILGSAFYGAITGAVSSAVIGGVIGGISSVVSGDGFFSGFIEGASTGFMSGALIGGAIGALTAGINIATGAVKIVGSAQKTGTFFHRFASNVSAGKMAMQVGRYSQITLDRSLNKAGMVGRKMPDVMGKARWGRDLIVEVTSKSQTHAQMAKKLDAIIQYNPGVRKKIIDWAAWIGRHLF